MSSASRSVVGAGPGCRQRIVSRQAHRRAMSTDDDTLVRLLVSGDLRGVHARCADREPVTAVGRLVACLAGLSADQHLVGAAHVAQTTRDRQLVAIVTAHTSGDADRVAALVRDHLVDHPDSLLGVYVASLIATPSAHRTSQE